MRLLAETFDGGNHHITRLQINRRLLAEAHARRRAGEDHIARLQTHETADVGHKLGHGENHVARRATLHEFAVYAEAQRQILRIRDLVACGEKRPEWREGVSALALEALPAAIELKVALGKIDADAVAQHV